MDSFISWIGGKKLLRKEIISRFPIEFDKYVEVFGGAGGCSAATSTQNWRSIMT